MDGLTKIILNWVDCLQFLQCHCQCFGDIVWFVDDSKYNYAEFVQLLNSINVYISIDVHSTFLVYSVGSNENWHTFFSVISPREHALIKWRTHTPYMWGIAIDYFLHYEMINSYLCNVYLFQWTPILVDWCGQYYCMHTESDLYTTILHMCMAFQILQSKCQLYTWDESNAIKISIKFSLRASINCSSAPCNPKKTMKNINAF